MRKGYAHRSALHVFFSLGAEKHELQQQSLSFGTVRKLTGTLPVSLMSACINRYTF